MKRFFYLLPLLFVAGCAIPVAVAVPMFVGAAITGAGAAAGAGGVIALYDNTVGRITNSPTPVPTPAANPKLTSPYNEGHDAASPW